MTLTSHRIIQYLAILLILTLGGGGYWYWKNAQAAVTQKAASKTGLVGYWSFDEGSGTGAGDASGNGNTGTLTNGPTWTTGKLKGGVSFDGTDDYVTYASNIAFNSADFTVSTWVKVNGAGGGDGTYPIFEQRVDATGNGQPAVTLGLTTTKNLSFVARDNVGAAATYTESAVRNFNQWYHVVAVKTSSTVLLYVDGTFIGSTSHSLSGDFDAGAVYRDFGRYRYGGINQAFLNGVIDEPRIYNRALGATEITSLYNLGAAKLNTSQNTSIANGLIGEWSFNGPDVSGTTAYDRSGSSNNGTLTNGPVAAIGKVGQAMSFDGSNDYVTAGDIGAVDTVTALTTCSWVRHQTITTDDGIVAKEDVAGGNGFLLFRDDVGSVSARTDMYSLVVWDSADVDSTRIETASNTSPLQTWTHVCGTFLANDANGLRLYVNGVATADNPVSTVGISAINGGTNSFVIGARSDTTMPFDGSIDESRIYNRVLTQAEITDLYNLGDADKVNSSASQPQGTGRLDSGLAGYWKLDENTGTSVGDASTNGNTGTLTNSPTWTTGQIGSAVTFNGSNQYMTVSGPTFASSGAISFWIYPSSFSGSRYVFDSTNNRYLFYQNNGSTGAWVWYLNGTSIATNISLPINTSEWHHVTLTWDNGLSSDKEKIFVNGNQVVSFNVTVGSSQPSSMYIGSRQSFSEIWNGSIDEVRIYNRALAADEVKQLYQTTVPTSADTSLKGYWSFNGQDVSGTTAYDRSGAGNNGTLTSSPTAAIGKAGQALSFNGTTSFVDLGAPTALDLSGVNKFTLSAWVYPTATPNGAGVITEMYTSTVQYTIGFSNNVTPTGNSYPTVGFYNGAWRAITESRAIDLNQWSLITGTWDGTTMNLYRNGALVATGTPGGPMPSADFLKVVIGKRHDTAGTTNFFPGRIDEARIYNRALTATEVLALYNLGR